MPPGRPRLPADLRALIANMAAANRTGGEERIASDGERCRPSAPAVTPRWTAQLLSARSVINHSSFRLSVGTERGELEERPPGAPTTGPDTEEPDVG